MKIRVVCLIAGSLLSASVANAQVWAEINSGGVNGATDAGGMLANANVTVGMGPLTTITGQLVTTGDADLFAINITDPANFLATVPGGGAGDTNLTLFSSTGVALAFNNNDPVLGGTGSRITNAFVGGAGLYYLAVTRNDSFGGFFGIAVDSMFNPIFASSPNNVELAPITAGTVLFDWPASGGFQLFNYSYTVTLAGAEYAQVPAPLSSLILGLGGIVAMRRRR